MAVREATHVVTRGRRRTRSSSAILDAEAGERRLGFFLFVGSEDGIRTIKLTPQLVKSGVSVFLFGSIGLFANRNMLREM